MEQRIDLFERLSRDAAWVRSAKRVRWPSRSWTCGVCSAVYKNTKYVVTGALAMVFYGYVRNTEDLDIVVAPDQENLDRVTDRLISIDAVLKLNPQPLRGAGAVGLHKGSHPTVLTSLGQIDVVPRLPRLPDWPTLVAEAEVYEVERHTVRVMNRSTWAGLKRRRGSREAFADIDAIERLAEL